MSKIIPTIGRIVWYKDSTESDQMLAGKVAYVHSEDMVNLSLSNKAGKVFACPSVPFHHGDAEECPEGWCCWMPYQKAQAEKHKDD